MQSAEAEFRRREEALKVREKEMEELEKRLASQAPPVAPPSPSTILPSTQPDSASTQPDTASTQPDTTSTQPDTTSTQPDTASTQPDPLSTQPDPLSSSSQSRLTPKYLIKRVQDLEQKLREAVARSEELQNQVIQQSKAPTQPTSEETEVDDFSNGQSSAKGLETRSTRTREITSKNQDDQMDIGTWSASFVTCYLISIQRAI
jgi:hypothetical protein